MSKINMYSPEFKLQVAKAVVESGYSSSEAHKEFDVGPTAIRRWAKQFREEKDGYYPYNCKSAHRRAIGNSNT